MLRPDADPLPRYNMLVIYRTIKRFDFSVLGTDEHGGDLGG